MDIYKFILYLVSIIGIITIVVTGIKKMGD